MAKPELQWVDGQWVEQPAAKPELVFSDGEWVPSEEVDFSAMEMVKNIPGSALEAGKGLVEGLAEIPKSMRNVYIRARGGTPEEPSLDALIADPSLLAEIPGQMADYVKGRYGNVERFQQSLMDDPVGVMLDLSAVGGVGLKGLQGMGKAGRALAENTYGRLAKFSTTIPWKQREAMIKTALDDGIYPTRKGVQKVEDRMDILGAQIDDIISAAQDANELIPIEQIFRHMDDLRSLRGGMRVEATDDLKKINQVERKLRERFAGQGGRVTHIRPEEMQKIKTDIYDKAYKKERSRIGQGKTPETTKTQAYRALGRGAKEAIEEVVPEVKDVNRQWGELSNLRTPLTQAANRLENRNWLNLSGTILGGGAGGLGGGLAAGASGATVAAPLGAIAASVALSPAAQRQFIRAMNQAGKLRDLPDVPGLVPAATVGGFTLPGRIEEDD